MNTDRVTGEPGVWLSQGALDAMLETQLVIGKRQGFVAALIMTGPKPSHAGILTDAMVEQIAKMAEARYIRQAELRFPLPAVTSAA